MQKALYAGINLISELSPKMEGVFSTGDLMAIFNMKENATFFNAISQLISFGILNRFSRGLYIAQKYSSLMVSARIDCDAYISMGSVLTQNGLIGTNPEKIVSAVKVGKKRSYSGSNLEIRHYGISKDLYFGFSSIGGIKVADNEKAYIDVLYYRMKGERYPFDELSDIDLERLNKERCRQYLKRYKNKNFVTFCLDQLHG